jgi:kynurenine formamidase
MLIDLSHAIEDGMSTFRGLPGPRICDYWTREHSAQYYDDGSTFQIGRIDLVANTGTYLDTPFHRYADGADLAAIDLERLAALPGLVVRADHASRGLAVDADRFEGLDVAGKAVLVHTGWDRHWRTEAYLSDHPFLTEAAARLLAGRGAALVGIDSHNIDDTRRCTASCSATACSSAST